MHNGVNKVGFYISPNNAELNGWLNHSFFFFLLSLEENQTGIVACDVNRLNHHRF